MRMHSQANAFKSTGMLLLALLLGVLSISNVQGGQAGRILVVFQEKQMGILGTTGFEQPGTAETLLIGTLRDHGYDVVDSETVQRNIVQSKGLRLLEGNDKAAAALGLQYGAEYTIVGKAISKPAGGKLYGSNLQSIHATVTARLIRNADARVLSSASGSETTARISHSNRTRRSAKANASQSTPRSARINPTVLKTNPRPSRSQRVRRRRVDKLLNSTHPTPKGGHQPKETPNHDVGSGGKAGGVDHPVHQESGETGQ